MKRKNLFRVVVYSMALCTVLSICGCGDMNSNESSSSQTKESTTVSSSEVLSTNSSSVAEESVSEESNLVIHCDTSNVLANEYYKSFIYGDGEDQIVKVGWVIPKGKYRIDVVNTKAWVQVSIYVAESGTVEPTTTPKNKTPLLLKKEETAVIEVDGNEYIYITEPNYITLTLIDE